MAEPGVWAGLGRCSVRALVVSLCPHALPQPRQLLTRLGPLETALLVAPSSVWFVTSSKGAAEHWGSCRQPAGHNERLGGDPHALVLSPEPGPFVPHTSMPWSRGPEHVAEAPCTPHHSPHHPGGDLA